jgi:hypothetical protein
MTTSIHWTEFSDQFAGRMVEHVHAWDALVEFIREAGGYAEKKACPWIKLATFGQQRTGKGALRHDDNVVELYGVEGDYDGMAMQPEEGIRLLERAGVRACVYTSPSHTTQKPRWRVLAPLSHPMPPSTRSALLARINGVLGGILAAESFTLSQAYYYGALADAVDYKVLVTFDDPDDGHCVDELDELDELAVGKAKVNGAAHDNDPNVRSGEHVFADRVRELSRKLKTGDGRREMLKAFIASRSARGLRGDDLRLLVEGIAARYFDAADPAGADIDGLIAWANQRDDAAQREEQRQRAQAIGDGTADELPLADQLTIDDMVAQLVYVSDGARVARRDRPYITLPLSEFKLHTAASLTRVGKKLTPIADLWVQAPDRITAHTLTFRPGHGEFTTDPEGADALNLWKPRERSPSTASVQPFLDHVAYLVPEQAERERFLDWLAHIEQRPGVLPHTSYLMVTPMTGIGRNWLASVLARVWAGATRLGFDLVGAMNSGFNGPLSRRLLVIVDELKAADSGYGAAQHAQQLKAMLTTEHRTINPKFGRMHVEFNCARFLMFSQHFDALPLEKADRRVIVISNPTERMPVEYYRKLYSMLDDIDFVNAVAAWLAQRDISNFNPSEPAPMTESKKQAVEASMSDVERALIDLREGTPQRLMTSAAIGEYLDDCGLRVPQGRGMAAAYAAAGLVRCKRMVTLIGKKHRVVALHDGDKLKDASSDYLLAVLRET